MKQIILMFALLVSLAGAACQGTPSREKQPAETTATQAGASDSSQQLAYICPMACEGSASNEPGKCPACGMDLQKNPDHRPLAADSTARPTP